MQLFNNEYILIELHANDSLYIKWTEATAVMPTEFFKQVNLWYVEYFSKYPIKSVMINTQDFKYTIEIEVQEWVGTQIIPQLIAKGLKKLAFIVSKDLFSQFTIEQTMDESKSDVFTLLYFEDEAKANTWLKS